MKLSFSLKQRIIFIFLLFAIIPVIFAVIYLRTNDVSTGSIILITGVSFLSIGAGLFLLMRIILNILAVLNIVEKLSTTEDFDEIERSIRGPTPDVAKGLKLIVEKFRNDISEFKNYSQQMQTMNLAIRKKLFLLKTIHLLSEVVIEKRDLKDTLQIIIDEIIEATKSKKIFLIILNEGGTVNCFSSSDYGKKTESIQELLNQKNSDYWVNILTDKRPFIFSDESELSEQIIELKSLLDLKTGVISPFFRYDTLAGLLFLGDKEDEVFTTGDLPTISAFTDLISIACENARLYFQLEMLRTTDMISGIKNQRYFRERLEQEFLRAVRHNLSLSLAVIDIVNFKKINETVGYNKADIILAEFGKLIRESIRSIDIPARMIADEFAILFPETPLQSAQLAIERLRKKSNEFFATSEAVPPGISISFDVGLVICDDKMSDENEFYDLARSKLKEAKEKRMKKAPIKS